MTQDSLTKKIFRQISIFGREVLPLWVLAMLTNWWPDYFIFARLRGALHKPFFRSCGKRLRLNSGARFLYPSRIKIGNNVLIGVGNWIDGSGGVEIEDEVILAPYCVIASSKHTFKDNSATRGQCKLAPVKIGFGSWIAANVTISAGVTIGSGSLVACNSAVVKNIPSNVIAGGVPAKIISERK
jgi:acetyltransferase-like isoleucine patch superfamily enzyme